MLLNKLNKDIANERCIKTIQKMMFENLYTNGDICPNTNYDIMKVIDKYCIDEEKRYLITREITWLNTYFTHCRHMKRPIDEQLVTNLIKRLTDF